jgi:transposase-like protein
MITNQLLCRHCGSAHITRHGLTNNGKQRYLCHDCQHYSRDNPQPNGYPESERETILRAYDERSSLRGLTRTFGVSRNTVTSWLKKREESATTGTDPDRARRKRL